ncbi:hypothetical protein EXIGLDRAFT_406847 [Exidia glandulosa HHB12029]|uniref:Uncharacterized protein n=1 Tax=Exidia glandulosa HHB12029 TaxID=1314781 RepID=A0A165BIB2_EXIGL|nr:hypothetical protein EXIGLDRAFT_406847 [Exidia glandulosa HHB12029]
MRVLTPERITYHARTGGWTTRRAGTTYSALLCKRSWRRLCLAPQERIRFRQHTFASSIPCSSLVTNNPVQQRRHPLLLSFLPPFHIAMAPWLASVRRLGLEDGWAGGAGQRIIFQPERIIFQPASLSGRGWLPIARQAPS